MIRKPQQFMKHICFFCETLRPVRSLEQAEDCRVGLHHIMIKLHTLMLLLQAWLEETALFIVVEAPKRQNQDGARRGKRKKKALVPVVKGPNTNNGVRFSPL